MLLERGARGEVSELFERRGLVPDIQFKTLDDYAVMSMVECGPWVLRYSRRLY